MRIEIHGIEELILSFVKTIPGRSWLGYSAAEVKRLILTEEDNIPGIANPPQLSLLIMNELSSFKQIYKAEAHHDLIGHILTFSHALNDPIRLLSPVDSLPLVKASRSEWLPNELEFWSSQLSINNWDYGHLFKFPFSFYNHKNRLINNDTQATENFRYLIHSD